MNELRKNLCHLMRNRERVNRAAFEDLLQRILFSYSNVGWELGKIPGHENSIALSLSYGNDELVRDELYRDLEGDVYENDWAILIGIPPREWELFFKFKNNAGCNYDIEAGGWYWSSYWLGGKVKLEFEIPTIEDCDEETMKQIIHIALAGELGENNIINSVLDVTYRFYDKSKSPVGNKMNELRMEFVEHLQGADFFDFLNSVKSNRSKP